MRNTNRSWVWPARISGVVALVVTIYLFTLFHSSPQRRPHTIDGEKAAQQIKKPLPYSNALREHIEHSYEIAQWTPPAGMRVIGLVFYGRRRFVSVLNCYLQRNLVDNGGIIEEYMFLVKTHDKEDLDYLEKLLAKNPKYSAKYTGDEVNFDYSHMWSNAEKGNVYVKIDDDVLFIEDSTIRSIVKRKVEHPEYVIVSANVVNHFTFAWLHYHLGAIHPYLPELTPLKDPVPTTWRKSQLPYWDGPENFTLENYVPPDHHRWLPIAPGTGGNDKTPIADIQYVVGGLGWDNWTVGAQQHYSFLENLEKNELWRYAFDMWDAHYARVSINLMAILGDEVVAMGTMPRDDEEFITEIYSKRTGKHVVADGHGVAVHHGYWLMSKHDDVKGMETTDVLDRYRLYAEENICL